MLTFNPFKRLKSLLCFVFFCFSKQALALEVPIYDFPITHYSQNINEYFQSQQSDYKTPLLSHDYQQRQLKAYYRHTYQSDREARSPWGEQYVTEILSSIKEKQLMLLKDFDNEGKEPLSRHYGENFKEHGKAWLSQISKNMHLSALTATFYLKQRAIITNNTLARALPDNSPDFQHFSKPGEGFPFDNLQESSLWLGTPVYVVHTTLDKRWSLVITPDDYYAWVKNEDLAWASSRFIREWQKAAQHGMLAITKTEAVILNQDNSFYSTSYVGSVFPLKKKSKHNYHILTPMKEHQHAVIKTRLVARSNARVMPLTFNKENVSKLLAELIGRPYGWGGAFFFNDCSQELKSLFAPFGVWLPRNSSKQAAMGKKLDLSNQGLELRLKRLKEQGKPLLTLIHLNGHVMLYLGIKEQGTFHGEPMTYQNIWGLAPISRDKRYVIGQSLFLPLLKSYQEAPDATSLADKSLFELIFLDELTD